MSFRKAREAHDRKRYLEGASERQKAIEEEEKRNQKLRRIQRYEAAKEKISEGPLREKMDNILYELMSQLGWRVKEGMGGYYITRTMLWTEIAHSVGGMHGSSSHHTNAKVTLILDGSFSEVPPTGITGFNVEYEGHEAICDPSPQAIRETFVEFITQFGVSQIR